MFYNKKFWVIVILAIFIFTLTGFLVVEKQLSAPIPDIPYTVAEVQWLPSESELIVTNTSQDTWYGFELTILFTLMGTGDHPLTNNGNLLSSLTWTCTYDDSQIILPNQTLIFMGHQGRYDDERTGDDWIFQNNTINTSHLTLEQAVNFDFKTRLSSKSSYIDVIPSNSLGIMITQGMNQVANP